MAIGRLFSNDETKACLVLFPVFAKAPICDLGDQLQWQFFAVGQLYCAFAGLIRLQLNRKFFNCLRPGVKTDVVLCRGEMDDVAAFPERGHTPRYTFFRIRDRPADSIVDRHQAGPDGFILL